METYINGFKPRFTTSNKWPRVMEMRKAAIVDVERRGWDSIVSVPRLPSFDVRELKEILEKVKQVKQPSTWTEEARKIRYFRVEWYGESREFVSIQALVLASDNRFYAIPTYIIVNIRDGYVADHGFWHPSIVDTLLDALK